MPIVGVSPKSQIGHPLLLCFRPAFELWELEIETFDAVEGGLASSLFRTARGHQRMERHERRVRLLVSLLGSGKDVGGLPTSWRFAFKAASSHTLKRRQKPSQIVAVR